MPRRSAIYLVLAAAFVLALPALPAEGQLMYRPSRDHRTINTDTYTIVVQKNGRIDLILPSGEVIVDDAYPAVWMAGEDQPRPLPIEGRQTSREPVRDMLGQGQGMFFRKDGAEWVVRSYITQPFITVQAAFTNTSRRPVTVSRIIPWMVGEPVRRGAVLLGPDTDTIIARPHDSLTVPWDETPGLQHGFGHSGFNLAVLNPATGRSLVAGFLTDGQGTGYIEADTTPEGAIHRFRAVTVFDPPVELAPGERIESDAFYLAIAEPDPVSGLARFGNAFARANAVTRGEPVEWTQWWTPAAFAEVHGDRIGRGFVPVVGRDFPLVAPTRPVVAAWEAPAGGWGILDAIAWLGAGFHFTPYLARPVLEAAALPGSDGQLPPHARLAWYTFCALAGAPVISIGDDSDDPAWRARLDRLAPAIERPGRPADAFVHDAPRVWHAHVPSVEGDTHLVGLFNWDPADTANFVLDFFALGLSQGHYTVFEFWEQRYYGLAQGRLNVEVAPGNGRLFALRPLQSRPMLIADNAHFAMGAGNPRPAQWDDTLDTLTGVSWQQPEGSSLHLRVPPPFRLVDADVDGRLAHHAWDGEMLLVPVPPGDNQVPWRLRFRRTGPVTEVPVP